MSLYPTSDSEDDNFCQRGRNAITPKAAWERWTLRRAQGDIQAIEAEVAEFLSETLRFQRVDDGLFRYVQAARLVHTEFLVEVTEEITRQVAEEQKEEDTEDSRRWQ